MTPLVLLRSEIKNGDIISKNTPAQHLTHFTIVNWPNVTSRKRILLSEDKTIWLLNFDGKTIAKYDAPNCHNLGTARGTLVRLLKNQAEYFAVTVEYNLWNRTILYVYNPASELVYQENLTDQCSSIMTMHNDWNTESLLVGCTDYMLKFDVSKINLITTVLTSGATLRSVRLMRGSDVIPFKVNSELFFLKLL